MNGAVGAAARNPAIPAKMSVLWTFFNLVPFALRAPKQAHECGWSPVFRRNCCFGECRLGSGTTAGAWFARRALARRLGGTLLPSAAPLTRGRWIRFLFAQF